MAPSRRSLLFWFTWVLLVFCLVASVSYYYDPFEVFGPLVVGKIKMPKDTPFAPGDAVTVSLFKPGERAAPPFTKTVLAEVFEGDAIFTVRLPPGVYSIRITVDTSNRGSQSHRATMRTQAVESELIVLALSPKPMTISVTKESRQEIAIDVLKALRDARGLDRNQK